MIPAENPYKFFLILEKLRNEGALGVLVSGGADIHGKVPIEEFIPVIKSFKEKYPLFKIIIHTGLINKDMAERLKEAKVDQILIDIIGDEKTINEVYHLEKRVEDYEDTLLMLKDIGHHIAPHIIIGHHFGEIRGELRALDIVTRVGVDTIVLVIYKPLIKKYNFKNPTPEEISKISAICRILNPTIPIRMGCIRPSNSWKKDIEKGAIDAGVNTIAYPLQATIEYAQEIGLETSFVQMCCSLIEP